MPIETLKEEQADRLSKKLSELLQEIAKVALEIGNNYNLDDIQMQRVHHELIMNLLVVMLQAHLKLSYQARESIDRPLEDGKLE